MYVISPSPDCAEVKELIRLWRGGRGEEAAGTAYRTVKMGGKEFRIPLLDLVSVCALLVWQPADPCEPVTRLLFPGSAPQHKILEGLEILKPHLEYLKSPVCLIKNLTATVQPRSRSPVKAKTSPRHTAAAAPSAAAPAAPKKKEVEANKTTSSSSSSSTPRPVKSAEVKVKAVDSAALMSSSSSRTGSGEIRVVKKTEAKTVSNSKPLANKKEPAASISNGGETAKKIVKKEVEAKVQSFKNSASLKRAEENNKLVKKETESTTTTRTRSQSQKRSASSTRAAGNDENKPVTIKSIKKVTTESSSGSPAKTPPKPTALAVKLNSSKSKESTTTTTKSSSSASKEIKKEKPKSSAKTNTTTKETAAPKSAAAPTSGSRAVKRPAKTTAAALVATTAATVAVAIPHEEDDGQPPVEEVVFGSEEAPQAASSPVKSQQGDEAEGAAADPVDIESQILQADEDEQLQVELEETAAGEEEMEEEEDKEGITIDAEEVNNGNDDAAGTDGVEPVEPEEEQEEEEEERQTEVDVVQETEENEIIDTQEVAEEDQGEQHQSEAEEDVQQQSASPAFQADESAEPEVAEDSHEGEQEDIKETTIDSSEVEFTTSTQFPQAATTDVDESEKQVYSAADDEGEEDNASSTAADGHDKADSVVGSMQVAHHQQLSDGNDDNDPESTLANESKVDSLITEEKEKEEEDEPQSQQPDEFTFTQTSAPAQSEKYPQGKDPLERNTPYVIVSASSATTSNEEVNEEEFTAEIIERPVVVPDPDLVTPQPPSQGVKNSEEVIRPKAPEQLDDDSADEVEEETFQKEIKTKDSAVPILPEDEKKAPGSSVSHHEDDNTKEEEKKPELVVALPPEEPAKKTESSKLMADLPDDTKQKVSDVDDDVDSTPKTGEVKDQADSFSDEELERDAESTTEEEKLSGPSDDEEVVEEEQFVSKSDVKHSVQSTPPRKQSDSNNIIEAIVSATTLVEAQFHSEHKQEDVELDAHEENQTFVTSVDVKGDLTEVVQVQLHDQVEEENIPAVLESVTEPDHQPDEDESTESVEANETPMNRTPFTAPLTASTPIDGPDVIEILTFQQVSAKEIDDDSKESLEKDEIALPTLVVQKDEIIKGIVEDLSQVTVASIPSNPAENVSSSKVGVEMELESAKDEEPCLVTNRDAAKETESIKPAPLEDIKKEVVEVKEEEEEQEKEEAFMKNVQEVEAISIAVKEDIILNKDIAEVKEDKVALDSAKETILAVKENINMILKEVKEEKGSISIAIKGEPAVSTMKDDVISLKDVKEIEEARSTIKDIKEEILMAVKNEKVAEETAIEEIPIQSELINPITQDVKVEKESVKEDSNLHVDEKPSEPSVIPPKVTEDAISSTNDVIIHPESDASIQSSVVEIQLDGKVCQLKPEDALESGQSSASVTPKSPLSPNPVRRPMDDETAIVKDVAKPSSSIDSDVRSTTSSSSWTSERVEREVEEDDDTLMPSVAPSYLAGYEGVSVGVSKLSTIASSDGEQQPQSMESNASSKTYEKLMSQPAPQPEESAFSSGPSSWDAEREQQLASKPTSSFMIDSDQSATSSLTSIDEPSSRVPLMKPSAESPIPPASPRESESNKDSLSSIPTSTDEPITIVPSKTEVMDRSISPVPTSSPFGVIDSSEIKKETLPSSAEPKKEALSEISISPVPPSSPLKIEESSKCDLDAKRDSISSIPTSIESEKEAIESSINPVLVSSLLQSEQCATKSDSETKRDSISSSSTSVEPKKESIESSVSPVPLSSPYNIERSTSRGDSEANIQAAVELKKESIETSVSPVPPSSPYSIERSSSRGDSEASKDSIQSIPATVEPKKELMESSISPVPPSSPYSIERSSSRGDSEASKDSIQSIPATVEPKKELIESSISPVPPSSPYNIERSSSRGDSEASKDSIRSIPASIELKKEQIDTSISPVPSSSPFSIERSSSRGESEASKDSIQSIPTSTEPKKELIESSISPIPSSSPFSMERSSSRGDSEANKDSLSSIQTTGSSDYQLETKVDDSASGCSAQSDYSDQHQQLHLQRVSTPQSDISSASESTTSQLIQPMDVHQSSSASSKVELVDPKLAPHNLWLKEKEERASSNPFSDRYEDDSALPDPLMDEMMAAVPAANYYAGVGHHSDDVDSDRQSDSQYPDEMVYPEQQTDYDESGKDAEGYLYESEQDDNYLAYSAEDCYHGDHQNGNSYDYHEPSTIQGFSHHQGGSIQQQQQQNANQDLNRNNDPPRDQTAPELSRQVNQKFYIFKKLSNYL